MDNLLNIIPLPGLHVAFSILKSIWISIDQIQACQSQLKVLGSCTTTLLGALDDQYRSGKLTEESTSQQLQDLNRLLKEIATFVQRRSAFSFLRLLFVKDQVLTMIDAYQSQIRATIGAFQISALIDVLQWKKESELARKADQQSLCLRLEMLAADQRLLAEALNVEKNNPMAMMATFKKRIDEQKGEKEELTFYRQSFGYLSTTSRKPVDIKPWTISAFDVETGERIGAGAFGVVYRGTWNQTEVALKMMKNSESIIPRPAAILREVETWSKLRHPHILQFFGANILDNEPFIVMPLIASGNVNDYIDNNPNCDRLRLLKQISLGIAYLHSQDIIHGDLKGANILVDDGEKALLCDFGLSRIKADINSRSIRSSSALVGSPNWMAPEVFQGEILGFPCDVYSFAMTMYEVFTNEIPLGHIEPSMLYEFVVDRKIRPRKPNMAQAPQLSDEAWTIIQLCWEAKPTSRPTANVVCTKLNIIQSVYPTAVPSNPLPENLLQNKIFAKDFEPISRPSSPATFPRFWPKHQPMTRRSHRTSLTLKNPENVTSVLQSSDDNVLIVGLSEGSCILWNPIKATTIVENMESSSDPVTAITFESSTSTYVTGFKSGCVIYNHKSSSHSASTLTLTGNNKPVICLHVSDLVMALAPSADSGNRDLVIIKWCLSVCGYFSSIIPLHEIDPSSCLCAAFSFNGKEVYIGTSSGSLFISSTSDGQFVHRPLHLSSPPEGDTLSRRNPSMPDRHFAVAECRSLALSPCGKKIMVSYSSGEIRLWDIRDRSYSVLRVAGDIKYSNSILTYSSLPVTFSSDGSYVAYASASHPRAVDIQIVNSKQVSYIDLDGAPMSGIRSLHISPNNKRLIVSFHNSNRIMVCVWD